jgi:hypothetical protein
MIEKTARNVLLINIIDTNSSRSLNIIKNDGNLFKMAFLGSRVDNNTYIHLNNKYEYRLHQSGGMDSDNNSLWLFAKCDSIKNFSHNHIQEIKDWIFQVLYVLRVLRNENFNADLFLRTDINNSSNDFFYYQQANVHCKSGSKFHNEHNVKSFLPFIELLLKWKPTASFLRILENLVNACASTMFEVEYFYLFSAFDGLISNWAENAGYGDLWGSVIATESEQNDLQNTLRKKMKGIINDLGELDKKKIKQLDTFRNDNFPTHRPIRRTLKDRFMDYVEHRLPEEIKRNPIIVDAKKQFGKMYRLRNSLGHSSAIRKNMEEFGKYFDILTSTVYFLLQYELDCFLKGKKDWKFEKRDQDFSQILSPWDSTISPLSVIFLSHFPAAFLYDENQPEYKLFNSQDEFRELSEVNLKSKIDDETLKYFSKLSLELKASINDHSFDELRFGEKIPKNHLFISMRPNPEWKTLISTQKNMTYIVHSAPPNLNRTYANQQSISKTEFNSESIYKIFKIFENPENAIKILNALDILPINKS